MPLPLPSAGRLDILPDRTGGDYKHAYEPQQGGLLPSSPEQFL